MKLGIKEYSSQCTWARPNHALHEIWVAIQLSNGLSQGHSRVEEDSNVPLRANLSSVHIDHVLFLSIVFSLCLLCFNRVRFKVFIPVFDLLEPLVSFRTFLHGKCEVWPHCIHLAHELSFVAIALVLHGRVEDFSQVFAILCASDDFVSSVHLSHGDSIEITSSPLCYRVTIVVRRSDRSLSDCCFQITFNPMSVCTILFIFCICSIIISLITSISTSATTTTMVSGITVVPLSIFMNVPSEVSSIRMTVVSCLTEGPCDRCFCDGCCCYFRESMIIMIM